MVSPGRLLVRADGGFAIGIGHVMRCLALAQAWCSTGGTAALVTSKCSEFVRRVYEEADIEIVEISEQPGSDSDATATARLAETLDAQCVVLDGYHFGYGFQRKLRSRGLLVVIDDEGRADRFDADLILNQNLHASPDLYRTKSGNAELLLGTSYTLLRTSLTRAGQDRRTCPPIARNVLITFGGSDPTCATKQALAAIRLKGLQVRVLCGPAASVPDGNQVEVLKSVTDLTPHMRWADLAITAAGSTCWELAFMGVPMIVIPVAPNQEQIAASLCEAGVAINGATHLASVVDKIAGDPDLRQRMADRAQKLVNGKGAHRVVDRVLALARTEVSRA